MSNVFTDILSLIWETSVGKVNRLLKGNMVEEYKLNSPEKLDIEKIRGIYHNVQNEYKLSAGMVKPIINADVSFIGEPEFTSEDPKTLKAIEELIKDKTGKYQSTHKVALREGDIYLWIQWNDKLKNVEWVPFTEDKIKEIIIHPVTGKVIQYVFEWNVSYKDINLHDKRMTIKILIDESVIVYQYTGDIPEGYRDEIVPNILKELPIVQISNEKEDHEQKGHSDITPIEPYLKAYHDVVMMALQDQKNHSTPKLKFKVKDVRTFISNNWGASAYSDYKAGNKPEGFSVEGLDLIFLQDNDEADYMTVSSTTGSAKPILELLFYLIVETSETIEVVFGANLGTSLASVNSQLPVYTKKVGRKQTQFEEYWKEVIRISLKFMGFVNINSYDGLIKIDWPEVDFETAKEKVERLFKALSTYTLGLKYNTMSFEEVHGEMINDIPSIIKDFKKHLEGVKETAMLIQKFSQDSDTQAIEMDGERMAEENELNIEEP